MLKIAELVFMGASAMVFIAWIVLAILDLPDDSGPYYP